MSGQDFSAKVALVTGAASGIGKAAALLFASRGARVVLVDTNTDGGQAVEQTIVERGGQACFVRTDVTDGEQVKRSVDLALDRYGRLDCALNNAGVSGAMHDVADMPEQEWRRVVDIMLTGVFLCMKHQIPHLLKTSGAIVNTASGVGLVGFAGQSAYTASKHGVLGLTKSASLEYASQGLNINAICPGTAKTEMLEAALSQRPELERELQALHPIGRIAEPEEIAEAALWLCSPAASFVSGVALPVDGGYVVP